MSLLESICSKDMARMTQTFSDCALLLFNYKKYSLSTHLTNYLHPL